jgi:hypothetical protein
MTDYRCNDCGVDVLASGDWYMADPKLWKRLGLGWKDNLCIACLEQRLGRAVKFPADVVPVVGTIGTRSVAPERLSDRLIALFAGSKLKPMKRAKPKP